MVERAYKEPLVFPDEIDSPKRINHPTRNQQVIALTGLTVLDEQKEFFMTDFLPEGFSLSNKEHYRRSRAMIAMSKLELDMDLRFARVVEDGKQRLGLFTESDKWLLGSMLLLMNGIWFDKVELPKKIFQDEMYPERSEAA